MDELARFVLAKTVHRGVFADEKRKEEAVSSLRYNKRRSAVAEVKHHVIMCQLHVCQSVHLCKKSCLRANFAKY